jgi:hypothetical protein
MKLCLLGLGFLTLGLFGTAHAATVATTAGPDTAPNVATVAGAFLTNGGTSAPGFTAGMARRLDADTPLYYGAEAGLYVATGTPSYLVIPLLANVHYLFQLDSAVHPLVGVMAGPVFATGGGLSAARFGLLFRPGVNIELGRSVALNVEARFGVIGSAGVFQPQLGVIFGI